MSSFMFGPMFSCIIYFSWRSVAAKIRSKRPRRTHRNFRLIKVTSNDCHVIVNRLHFRYTEQLLRVQQASVQFGLGLSTVHLG